MWLKTQGGKLVNLDTVEKIFIAGRKVPRSDYLWPTVYAQFSDANREADAVLFKSEFEVGTDSRDQGRKECQLYIDTLFRLIERAGVRARTIDHDELIEELALQIKIGEHPNLSTPEEEKADAA